MERKKITKKNNHIVVRPTNFNDSPTRFFSKNKYIGYPRIIRAEIKAEATKRVKKSAGPAALVILPKMPSLLKTKIPIKRQ